MTPLLYGILILIGGWIAIYLLFRGITYMNELDKVILQVGKPSGIHDIGPSQSEAGEYDHQS